MFSEISSFIGYSLSDINIRLLFYKLSKLWKEQKLEEAQIKSYIFLPRPNPIQEEILEQWRIGMISSETIIQNKSLEEF